MLIPVPLVLFAVGMAIYRLLMARALSVRFNRGMVQIFVTFGLAIFLRGLAQFTFGADFKSVSTSLLAADPGAKQPVIPIHSSQCFRRKPATHSD